MSGTLYVVATPIGHLGDITVRALDTLRAVTRIVAEDTRRTRTLLTHFAIHDKPISCIEAHASTREVDEVVAWLVEGDDVAMVTDAGMPAVSDPGALLVARAHAAGVRIVPLPGASAVTAAVAASGLVNGGFRFFGFLPRGGTARAEVLTTLLATPEAVVFFEAPQRVGATLEELARLCPLRPMVVAREMTKLHEEFIRGTTAEIAREPREWRGEITVVLAPDDGAASGARVSDDDVAARIAAEVGRDEPAKALAQRVAAWSGRSRREIYQLVLEAQGKKRPS
jgi:16S rRNA (cytidine1402-2'-O)-methyltransferase